MSNELAEVKTGQVIAPMNLIEIAVSSGADPKYLESLMNLQERYEANQARKAFEYALASFQTDCPIVPKTKKGHNGKYAPLEKMLAIAGPVLHEHGFTYRWDISTGDMITVTCILTHRDGHSESTPMSAESDSSGGKNAIQSRASAVSYLKRYTLQAVAGIITEDEDDDGGDPAKTVEKVERWWFTHNLCVQKFWQEIDQIKDFIADGNMQAAAEVWTTIGPRIEASPEAMATNPRAILDKASRRGGIFTVEETKAMKSEAFLDAVLMFDQRSEQAK